MDMITTYHCTAISLHLTFSLPLRERSWITFDNRVQVLRGDRWWVIWLSWNSFLSSSSLAFQLNKHTIMLAESTGDSWFEDVSMRLSWYPGRYCTCTDGSACAIHSCYSLISSASLLIFLPLRHSVAPCNPGSLVLSCKKGLLLWRVRATV